MSKTQPTDEHAVTRAAYADPRDFVTDSVFLALVRDPTAAAKALARATTAHLNLNGAADQGAATIAALARICELASEYPENLRERLADAQKQIHDAEMLAEAGAHNRDSTLQDEANWLHAKLDRKSP